MSRPAVVLIGPMGAGKTSIGRKAAKLLGVGFFDTDIAVTRAHGTIPDIFATHGEAQFRRWEREAVTVALAQGGVVALGGGAILNADTRSDLARHPVVLLTVSARQAAGRIRGTGRPLLAGDGGAPDRDQAMAHWSRIAAERATVYAQAADVTFDTSRGPIRDIAADVAAWVRRQWQCDEADAASPREGVQ